METQIELNKLRLVSTVQQEIINTQRHYIQELRKKLPEDDHNRWHQFLDHAMARLEVIHNRKNIEESSCKGA